MRVTGATVAVLAGLLWIAVVAQSTTSVWSGVYTSAQAASFNGEITLVATANPDEGGFYYGSNQLSNMQLSAVPEPAPMATMLGALAVFGLMARRRAGRD